MTAGAASRRGARPARRRDRLVALGGWLAGLVASGRLPAFLVALVSGLLAFAFLFTSDYPVSTVTVEGARVGGPREIAGASGLLGESLFHVEAQAAAERIGSLPYVEQVEVALRFPGEARVVVVEREPVMILQRSGERLLVDAGGRLIGAAGDAHLPALSASGASADTVTIPTEIVDAVREIAAVYGDAARLTWDARAGLAMTLEGRRIVFGEPEAIGSKLAALAAIEDQIEADWSELDLREPTRPAYR